MPSQKTDRVTTTLAIDLSESLERVENILSEELPIIHENLCAISGENIGGPKYRGVSQITENSVVLSFAIFCKGMFYGWMSRTLNGELKKMCERRNIRIARPQVVVHEGDHIAPPTDA